MAAFTSQYPDVSISLVDAEPPKALALLRNNDVDVAVVFAHEDTPEVGLKHVAQTALLEDPLYLITSARNADATNEITDYAGETWIAGCPSCRAHLLTACNRAGFIPRIEFETDDYVAVQALVASGSGVSTPSGPRPPGTSEPEYPRTPHSRRATHCLRRNLRQTSICSRDRRVRQNSDSDIRIHA